MWMKKIFIPIILYQAGTEKLLGGSSHDLYVVNNIGDRKSPRPGDIPLPNGR